MGKPWRNPTRRSRSRLAFIALLFAGACASNEDPPEVQVRESVPTSDRIAARAAGCDAAQSSDLPGVRLSFAPDVRCRFTLEEAREGISWAYELLVERELTVRNHGVSSCQRPGEHGLAIHEEIGDGDQNHWCICDRGLCPPSSDPETLRPGTYSLVLDWDGVNWIGPSDFGNPKGAAFPPGTYTVRVRARGALLEAADEQAFDVFAELPITLVEP